MKKLWAAVFLATMIFGLSARAGQLSNNFDVAFYGYIKVDTVFMDAKAQGVDYLVWAPPSNLYNGYNAAPEHYVRNIDDPVFGITARQTRFGFKIKGPSFGNDGQVLGKIEGDFYGSTYAAGSDSWENKGNFALRIAEVELRTKYWGILAGNEWMVMSPIFPHSSNYTYGAELGNLGYRMPQVRFTGYLMDGKLQIQAAADNKIGSTADPEIYADIDSGRNSGVPDGQFGIMWDTVANGKPFKLGVTGHIGKEVIGGEHNPSVPSWSWNIHYMLPATKWLSFNGEFYNGANLDGYYTGAQGKGWVRYEDGNYRALQDVGGWAELELGPFKSFQFYTGYTWDDVSNAQLRKTDIFDKTAVSNGSPAWKAVTHNQSYYASAHYWLVPKVTDVSLEWMQVATNYGLATGHDGTDNWHEGIVNRLTLSFWLFF